MKKLTLLTALFCLAALPAVFTPADACVEDLTVHGTVQFVGVSGGCWKFVGDDGNNYELFTNKGNILKDGLTGTLHGDLMDGLDLGLPYRTDLTRGAAYPQFPKSATGKEDTLAGANMRFRLEPTINISEDVRIMAQIDMLDNLILGSTPDGYPMSMYYPMVGFSQAIPMTNNRYKEARNRPGRIAAMNT